MARNTIDIYCLGALKESISLFLQISVLFFLDSWFLKLYSFGYAWIIFKFITQVTKVT